MIDIVMQFSDLVGFNAGDSLTVYSNVDTAGSASGEATRRVNSRPIVVYPDDKETPSWLSSGWLTSSWLDLGAGAWLSDAWLSDAWLIPAQPAAVSVNGIYFGQLRISAAASDQAGNAQSANEQLAVFVNSGPDPVANAQETGFAAGILTVGYDQPPQIRTR